MSDTEKAQIAKEWITKLANGINPLNGNALREDDIVNNIHISRCLFYVTELIDSAIKYRTKKSKEYELEFNITSENISMIAISDRTSISSFTREINKVIPENMRPISYTIIQNWLIDNGYLQEVVIENGGKRKFPTDTGNSIGITTELRTGISGQYIAVDYDSRAQRFILDNINKITPIAKP